MQTIKLNIHATSEKALYSIIQTIRFTERVFDTLDQKMKALKVAMYQINPKCGFIDNSEHGWYLIANATLPYCKVKKTVFYDENGKLILDKFNYPVSE